VKESTQHFTTGEPLECGINIPRLLIIGEPGSGKSYINDTLCELASVMKVGIVLATASYNCTTAVNIAIHNATEAAKISLTQAKVEELWSNLDLEKVCMIIVDEASTIDT
jgi:predicted ATP-dependent serine protease